MIEEQQKLGDPNFSHWVMGILAAAMLAGVGNYILLDRRLSILETEKTSLVKSADNRFARIENEVFISDQQTDESLQAQVNIVIVKQSLLDYRISILESEMASMKGKKQ